MTTSATSVRNEVTTVAHQPQAGNGLAIVRVTIGAMLVWVFFENLGKGLYTPAGYAGLVNYYITHGHSPALCKSVMALAASHAAMAAPLQARGSGNCWFRCSHRSESRWDAQVEPGASMRC